MAINFEDEVNKALAQAEIQRQLNKLMSPPSGRLTKIKAFMNSQVGMWLLGVVLVGGFTWVWHKVEQWNAEEEINNQKELAMSREDSEFLLKILPMMNNVNNLPLSCESAQVLIFRHPEFNGWKCDRDSSNKKLSLYENKLCTNLRDFLQTTMLASYHKDLGSEDVRNLCGDLLGNMSKALENPSISGTPLDPPSGSPPVVVFGPTNTSGPVSPGIAKATLVYLQIYAESDRASAKHLQDELRKMGFLAPGVENVVDKAAPLRNNVVRWYPNNNNSPDNPDLATAKEIQAKAAELTKTQFELQAGTAIVKPGTIEVWFRTPPST